MLTSDERELVRERYAREDVTYPQIAQEMGLLPVDVWRAIVWPPVTRLTGEEIVACVDCGERLRPHQAWRLDKRTLCRGCREKALDAFVASGQLQPVLL